MVIDKEDIEIQKHNDNTTLTIAVCLILMGIVGFDFACRGLEPWSFVHTLEALFMAWMFIGALLTSLKVKE